MVDLNNPIGLYNTSVNVGKMIVIVMLSSNPRKYLIRFHIAVT
jgi:hypothetical protein